MFSIIIPVYNVEKYLEQCLDSVLKQGCSDFEVLVINDGSMDNSGAICDFYAAKDSRVKMFHTTNQGLSAARNIGLKNASGKYIWFVDSDDWITENAFHILYNVVSSKNIDVIGFSNYHFFESTKHIRENPLNSKSDIINADKLITGNYLFEIAPWIYIFKRSFLDNNNIKFREDVRIHEDEFFLNEILVRLESIKFIKDKLYIYRIRDNSLMRSKRNDEKLYAYSELIVLYENYRGEFLADSIWNEKMYNTLLQFYKLYFASPEILRKRNKGLFKTVKNVKLGFSTNDILNVRILKILHKYSFFLFKVSARL